MNGPNSVALNGKHCCVTHWLEIPPSPNSLVLWKAEGQKITPVGSIWRRMWRRMSRKETCDIFANVTSCCHSYQLYLCWMQREGEKLSGRRARQLQQPPSCRLGAEGFVSRGVWNPEFQDSASKGTFWSDQCLQCTDSNLSPKSEARSIQTRILQNRIWHCTICESCPPPPQLPTFGLISQSGGKEEGAEKEVRRDNRNLAADGACNVSPLT